MQKALLWISFRVASLVHRRPDITWIVGVQEISSMMYRMAQLIPGSHSVALWRDPFYSYSYDSSLPPVKNPVIAEWLHAVIGPIMLGRLLARAQGVLYIGELGFLPLSERNRREHEFEFIVSRGRRLACYFVGSDIRATRLLQDLSRRTGRPNLGDQLPLADAAYGSDAFDASKRRTAAVADRFADVIFSASVDQLSYLRRPTHPITYFFPDELFRPAREKFDDLGRPVIVHAPSNPAIKGTPHVRAAIERLRDEGYTFEYVELEKVGNEVVRAELERAHIVLNQFYAFIPGVFGIEALASNCAVLQSADETVEPDLPRGSNEAWVVTTADQVYVHLRELLDHPERIEPQAARGIAWAREHVAFSSAGPGFRRILDDVLLTGRAPDEDLPSA